MINLLSISVNANARLSEAIRVIDSNEARIALVCDDCHKLIGTVTDGDVRRALLRGATLDSAIDNVMRREFRSLPEGSTETQALEIMRSHSLQQVPMLDKCGRAVKMFLYNELSKPKQLENYVVVMAGGKGERLLPLTENCPKPMLKVGGKPLLEIILEHCISDGFVNFVFSVNYLKDQIINHFGDGSRWNVNIRYIHEQRPLGTAGALGLWSNKPSSPILVINGDVLTRIDYSSLLSFHYEQDASATMCVREHFTQVPFGVVGTDGSCVQSIEEKPTFSHYVNAGIYVLNSELLEFVPRNEFYDMPVLIEAILNKQHKVSAFPIHEYWLDIGHPENLKRAHGEWK